MNERWLDPECDDPDGHPVSGVDELDESWLQELSAGVLREPLVAQRVLLARTFGVGLGPSRQGHRDLSYWGHSFASALAVLMPSPALQDSAERRKRRRYQEQLLKGQENWPDLAAVRNTAYLLCADNQPPEIGLPHQLYPSRRDSGLLDFEGFGPLLKMLTSTVSPALGPAWITGKPGLSEALTMIILETFRNTHDHARQEVDRSDVRGSVRGLYARYYSVPEIAEFAKQGQQPELHSPALRYARNFLPRTVPAGVRAVSTRAVGGLLELSVVDSGPGMAAKWLGRDTTGIPIDQQFAAVMACFEKGRSTTGTAGRGFGLAKVLYSLKELHGFMSLRTNQVHVYRQFAAQRDAASVEASDGSHMPDSVFYDWRRAGSRTPAARSAVKGTVVSFLIPMEG